jgi:hypothetical protein
MSGMIRFKINVHNQHAMAQVAENSRWLSRLLSSRSLTTTFPDYTYKTSLLLLSVS